MHRLRALAWLGLTFAALHGCYGSGGDSDEAAGGVAGQSGSSGKAGATTAGSPSGGEGAEGGSSNSNGDGGDPSSGGETNPAQGGQGGAGIEPVCDPTALLLIQRSGAMVEPVNGINGSANWWELLQAALVDAGGIVPTYGADIALGVSTFYLLAGSGVCPSLDATPLPANATQIEDHLTQAQLEAQQAVIAAVKSDGPLAPAVDQASAMLSAAAGPKYLIAIVFGYPDTCVGPQDQGECYVDDALTSVQAARTAGVTTIPIVLRGPVYETTYLPGTYEWYAQALANAGAGVAVGPLDTEVTPGIQCDATGQTIDGDYAGTPGAAPSYVVPETEPVADGAALAAALEAVFARVAACE